MLILDTDHISEIERNSTEGRRLQERLDNSAEAISITIVSVDEQLRGLLNLIKRSRLPDERIRRYRRLRNYVEDLTAWGILDWDPASEAEYARLQVHRLRISTMDLRIACIAIANNATLLTRNLRDFQKIPNLRVENWLDE